MADSPMDLGALDTSAPLSQKLIDLHRRLRQRFDGIDRIAVVVYDRHTDLLKTFIQSAGDRPALLRYEARLAEVPSLQELARTGRPRSVDDLSHYGQSERAHTRFILAAGYRASYTAPMFLQGEFYGFIFFDSLTPARFTEELIAHLDPFARLLALLVINERRSIGALAAASTTVRYITSRRDCETGAHLERMSRYCRLIAQELASTHGLSDEYIENLFLFAPLHDVGKVAIPDSILLKPGPLTREEFETMKTHTEKGLEIVDFMLREFGFVNLAFVDIMRNIVLMHHEAVDGSGYPLRLHGTAIPIEARITTVADMFDALTSRRPYKPAWSVEQTFAELRRVSDTKLDRQCVEALIGRRREVEAIQAQFQETRFG